ncbi:hypothetical protein SAMN05192553_101412 [Cyclobacterium xiamenense]|uniref:Tryptophan-rich sensory protein n=1 Tax=Cyclobacterium xiamenense TaxID=1297121 RepID=A0A1H6TPJ0_9BACT|nr:hypothetical protein [Cyclobacterium xiamenense]SEI81921.1 hypothetical protein SAMN05192553_101412 [Cyclobacterium xiamenense]
MKPLPLLVINSVTFLVVLLFNYLGSSGDYFGSTVGEVSADYQTLLTPAGYAFSIWGLIYLGWLAFLVFQWQGYLTGNSATALLPAGIWFSLANLSNALWVWAWTSGHLWLSLLLIAGLLLALIRLVINFRLELDDVPLRILFWVWWPICIYTGWVILATVLNTSVVLRSLGFSGQPETDTVWAVVILLVAAAIYMLLTLYRNMREAALVGAWGIGAIAVSKWEQAPTIGMLAAAVALMLLVTAGVHGYIHRDTSPLVKMKKGEWKY